MAVAASHHHNHNHTTSTPSAALDPPPPLHVPLGQVIFSSWAMSSLAWNVVAAADPSTLACSSSSAALFASSPLDAALVGALVGAALGGTFAALGSYEASRRDTAP